VLGASAPSAAPQSCRKAGRASWNCPATRGRDLDASMGADREEGSRFHLDGQHTFGLIVTYLIRGFAVGRVDRRGRAGHPSSSRETSTQQVKALREPFRVDTPDATPDKT